MQGEDLDAYIAKYEGLVLEAGFNLQDRLCLKMFTDGLPHDLYCYVTVGTFTRRGLMW
jgi:hypothetical protein